MADVFLLGRRRGGRIVYCVDVACFSSSSFWCCVMVYNMLFILFFFSLSYPTLQMMQPEPHICNQKQKEYVPGQDYLFQKKIIKFLLKRKRNGEVEMDWLGAAGFSLLFSSLLLMHYLGMALMRQYCLNLLSSSLIFLC